MTAIAVAALVTLGSVSIGILTGWWVAKRTIRNHENESVAALVKEAFWPYLYEGGPPGDYNVAAKLSRSFPVPNRELIDLVTPGFDETQFLRSGRQATRFLCGLLRANGVRPESLRSVLDFGCGCGRLLRHFPVLGIRHLELHGTDYNPLLIDWCRQNLPIADFQVNDLEGPLNYRDEMFDFVYAISVFTHLTEPLQFAFLQEMARILKPRGHLIITLHGAAFAIDLDEEQKRQFEAGQVVVKNIEQMGENTCGAYHPVRYVKENFTRAFELVGAIEPRQTRWQDAYLLRKKT